MLRNVMANHGGTDIAAMVHCALRVKGMAERLAMALSLRGAPWRQTAQASRELGAGIRSFGLPANEPQ
jgi:hypothetical protein